MKGLGRYALLFLAPLVATFAGCWGSKGSPSSNGGYAGNTGNAGGSIDGANVCNGGDPGTLVVLSTDSGISPAPAPLGGAVTDGSYHLTSSVYYPANGCVDQGVETRLTIMTSAAGTGTLQTATATGAGDFISESVSFTINATSLSVRIDCIFPDLVGLRGSSAQIAYSASPTEIQLYGSSGNCGDRIDIYDLD